MMVMCNDIIIIIVIIIEYDERRPGLPNAPLHIKHDNNRDHRDKAITPNIQTNIQTRTIP